MKYIKKDGKDGSKPMKKVGRPKGSPNKRTVRERQFIQSLLRSTREEAVGALRALSQTDPRGFLAEREKLMKYVCPTLSAVAIGDVREESSKNAAVEILYTILGVDRASPLLPPPEITATAEEYYSE